MSSGPLSDLPYADQYLRDILRPHVERAIQQVDRTITETAWRHVVRLLAAEQPAGNAETPAMIRRMLQDNLGLKLTTRLEFAFAPAPEEPAASPEVTVRPATMPLVGAMLAGAKRPSGK